MINSNNLPKAYKEVYIILKNMSEKYVKKIPNDIMNMIINNMDRNYDFEINNNKELREQDLLMETKLILSYIFLNYWSNKEDADEIKKILKKDIIRDEKLKNKSYSSDIFNNGRNGGG